MELLSVDTVPEARTKLFEFVQPVFVRAQTVSSPRALDRILASNMVAAVDVPAFTRSTVDGYAVRAADTAGAGESIPAVLSLAGEVEMGADAASFPGLDAGIQAGECAVVPTGAMLPKGADAVVMVEQTEQFGAHQVGIHTAVAVGTNVVQPGDDIAGGTLVCTAGTRLNAAEIGVAAALGLEELSVYAKPQLFIISTGDELVDPGEEPLLGQVRDINTWALRAQAEHAGFAVCGLQTVVDNEDELTACVEQAMQKADVVVISGGSSQGTKDATAHVIDTLASTGVLTHGLALKPGKPTITGFDERTQTLLVGLPGHPLSAMMVFEVFLAWLLREVQGTSHPLPVPATLTQNIPTAAGKDTLQLVSLLPAGEGGTYEGQLLATPVHTKSGLVSKLASAEGYIWIDRNTEGLRASSAVLVHLLKPL